MSQENVELVKRGYAAFAADGIEALVPSFTPDVLMHPFPEWLEQPVYRGHDGVRAIIAVWTENFDDFTLEVARYDEVGDRVLMLGETAGRIKGSGVPIRQPLGTVFSDFRDGRIGATHNFLTWQQALEAVGLSE